MSSSMATLFILLGLLTTCHGYKQCPRCISIDYSEVTELTESQKRSLPTEMNGFPPCNAPEMMTCEADNMLCSTANVRHSYEHNSGIAFSNVVLIERRCEDPGTTCFDVQKYLQMTWDKSLEGSGLTIDVDRCDMKMCDAAGENCIDPDRPTGGSSNTGGNANTGTSSNSYSGDVTSCRACMSFDYSSATGMPKEHVKQLPETVPGFAPCYNPSTEKCPEKDMLCSAASIRISFNFTGGVKLDNVLMIEKRCHKPETTCMDMERAFEAIWAKSLEGSGMSIGVDKCKLELCDESGRHCSDTRTGYGNTTYDVAALGGSASSKSLVLAAILPLLYTLTI